MFYMFFVGFLFVFPWFGWRDMTKTSYVFNIFLMLPRFFLCVSFCPLCISFVNTKENVRIWEGWIRENSPKYLGSEGWVYWFPAKPSFFTSFIPKDSDPRGSLRKKSAQTAADYSRNSIWHPFFEVPPFFQAQNPTGSNSNILKSI